MIVLGEGAGRLANRLVQFAHLIAFSAAQGVTVANPPFAEYAHRFRRFSGDPLCRFPPARRAPPFASVSGRVALDVCHALLHRRPRLPGLTIIDLDDASGELLRLDSPEGARLARRRGVVLLRGWEVRAPDSLDRHRDTVRAALAPDADAREHARELVARARTGAPAVVGVHVRRGDYARFAGGRFFYGIGDYAQQMTALQQLAGSPLSFVVCSDERIDAAAFRGLDVHVSTLDAVGDLVLLSSCDAIIGPPSTFSAWASFYGDVPLHEIASRGAEPRFRIKHLTGRKRDTVLDPGWPASLGAGVRRP